MPVANNFPERRIIKILSRSGAHSLGDCRANNATGEIRLSQRSQVFCKQVPALNVTTGGRTWWISACQIRRRRPAAPALACLFCTGEANKISINARPIIMQIAMWCVGGAQRHSTLKCWAAIARSISAYVISYGCESLARELCPRFSLQLCKCVAADSSARCENGARQRETHPLSLCKSLSACRWALSLPVLQLLLPVLRHLSAFSPWDAADEWVDLCSWWRFPAKRAGNRRERIHFFPGLIHYFKSHTLLRFSLLKYWGKITLNQTIQIINLCI